MADSKLADALDLNAGKRLAVLIQAVEDYVMAVETREKARKETILGIQVPVKEHVVEKPVAAKKAQK